MLMDSAECAFCDIINGRAPATIARTWPNALAVHPANPVTAGHLLVIPTAHVTDARVRPHVTADLIYRIATLVDGPCNIITSIGTEATQTVHHLSWHVIPRRIDDGVQLPWTGRQESADAVS